MVEPQGRAAATSEAASSSGPTASPSATASLPQPLPLSTPSPLPLETKQLRDEALAGLPAGQAALSVLYVFAGVERRSDIREFLESLCLQKSVVLNLVELDTCRNPEHDVLQEAVQDGLIHRLEAGEFHVLVITPPCNSWSRALFSGRPGPRPVRDRRHPWGYPWLQSRDLQRCQRGNVFVRFSIRACKVAASVNCFYLLEHPEDLGRTKDGFLPASIFGLAEMHELIAESHAVTAALFQCLLGAESCKPTRFVSTLPGMESWPYSGLPRFAQNGSYLGPLPPKCGSVTKHVQLIGQVNGVFATAAAASYPPLLCKRLAELIMTALTPKEPLRGGSLSSSSTGVLGFVFPPLPPNVLPPGEGTLVLSTAVSPVLTGDVVEPDGGATSGEDEFGAPRLLLKDFPGGRGPCLTTCLGGKKKEFCDGAGLCSPGRWSPCNRYSTDVTPTTSVLRDIIDTCIRKHIPHPDRLVYELSVGKHDTCPFSEQMIGEAREAWFGLLGPGPWDQISEFQPFYLLAVGETLRRMQDPDFRAFTDVENSFVPGVAVGMNEKMPRTPAVFC